MKMLCCLFTQTEGTGTNINSTHYFFSCLSHQELRKMKRNDTSDFWLNFLSEIFLSVLVEAEAVEQMFLCDWVLLFTQKDSVLDKVTEKLNSLTPEVLCLWSEYGQCDISKLCWHTFDLLNSFLLSFRTRN